MTAQELADSLGGCRNDVAQALLSLARVTGEFAKAGSGGPVPRALAIAATQCETAQLWLEKAAEYHNARSIAQ